MVLDSGKTLLHITAHTVCLTIDAEAAYMKTTAMIFSTKDGKYMQIQSSPFMYLYLHTLMYNAFCEMKV